MKHSGKLELIFAAAFFVTANAALGQTFFPTKPQTIQPMAPTYYSLSGEQGLMITVNLWGFVERPGQYVVPSSTNLVQLMSLAGGPTEYAHLDKVEIIRQNMQPDSTYKTQIIKVDLKEFQKKGNQTPLLSPGDTIIVPGSTSQSLRLILAILGPAFSLVTAIGTVILISRQ